MSSAEYVFDAIVLAPIEGELPKLIYRAQSIVAKDEDTAKLKAVKAAQKEVDESGVNCAVLNLDAIEVLVTRPFVDEDMILVTGPGYVAPHLPYYPTPSWYWPPSPPVWSAAEPVFISGFFGTGDNTSDDVKVTTGNTIDED